MLIPDDLRRAAHIAPAGWGTAAGAMVAQFLRSVTTEEARESAARQRRRLFDEVAVRNPGFSASERMTREQLYAGTIRGHERPAV